MATRKDANFLTQLGHVREEVRDKFSKVYRLLQEREAALLQQLREIEESYQDRAVADDEQEQELLATKEQLRHAMKGEENQKTLEAMLAPLDARLREIEIGEKGLHIFEDVNLEWAEELENKLNNIGRILLVKVPLVAYHYTRKGKPLQVACEHSEVTSRPGQFNFPTAIAIDPASANIYICDGFNHRIQVFTKTCDFLFLFKKKMNYPAGIEIHESRVFTTQYEAHTLCLYTINGEFLQSIGKKGDGKLQFNHPNGIAICPKRDLLYVCDRDNNRIQVISLLTLSLITSISELTRPKDINVHKNEIFVLDQGSPCIHVFDENHILLRELISYGNSQCQIDLTYRFLIDQDSNFLFADSTAGCVSIFTREGNLVHKLGKQGEGLGELIAPRGIAIDSEGRVIVASRNPKHCIQFF